MSIRKRPAQGLRRSHGRRAPPPRNSAPLRTAGPAARSASRARSAGLVGLVMATIMVAVGAYTVSSRVAAERQELAGMARKNQALGRQVAALQTELRVRMRLPQLQRWNDEVMRMQPAAARQILASPVELALFAAAAPSPMEMAPRAVVMPEAAPKPLLRAMPGPSAPALPEAARAPDPRPAIPAPEPATAPRAPALVLASVEAVLDAAPPDPAPAPALAVPADTSQP